MSNKKTKYDEHFPRIYAKLRKSHNDMDMLIRLKEEIEKYIKSNNYTKELNALRKRRVIKILLNA